MKVFSLALLTLLLAALWTGSQGVSFRSPYGACCYKGMFIRKKIPVSLIRSYQETPSHCSHKAVRVETRKGIKFCVDPEERWFQQYRLKKESTSASM
ncbi:CCL4 protein, partial [Mesembrinibis cayennensis]|nr:CCL4 protein [Mesembrinibis cayennensis]